MSGIFHFRNILHFESISNYISISSMLRCGKRFSVVKNSLHVIMIRFVLNL